MPAIFFLDQSTNAKVLSAGGANCVLLRGTHQLVQTLISTKGVRSQKENFKKLLKMPHKRRSHGHHKNTKEEKEVSFSLSVHDWQERMRPLRGVFRLSPNYINALMRNYNLYTSECT